MTTADFPAPLHCVILFGSYRRDTQGIRAVRYLERFLAARGNRVSVVNAAELGLPMLDRMYKEFEAGTAPAELESLAALYREADAFVPVAGEYNHSVQPGLSNLLDHFLEEYLWRPAGIVCYSQGGFGGVRAAMQMRSLLGEIGMPAISSILPISQIHQSLDAQGQDLTGRLDQRAARFADELEWYARALRWGRSQGTPF